MEASLHLLDVILFLRDVGTLCLMCSAYHLHKKFQKHFANRK